MKYDKKILIQFMNKIDYFIDVDSASYTDNLLPSANPPAGIRTNNVPMFVHIGFDDNMISGYEGSNSSGGVSWVLDLFDSLENPQGNLNPHTYDGTKCYSTLFCSSQYITNIPEEDSAEINKIAWFDARSKGHEIANHTHTHNSKVVISEMTESQWIEEVIACNTKLGKPFDFDENPKGCESTGINTAKNEVAGFRAPYLKYDNKLFTALKKLGFTYDSSIVEGMKSHEDGKNLIWPYTLNNCNSAYDSSGKKINNEALSELNGIWEFPIYSLVIPDDTFSESLNFKKGLRERIYNSYNKDNQILDTGKVLGLDYDLIMLCKLDKYEFLAILKYNFDLRYNNNRCPFIFVAHSEQYASNAPWLDVDNITLKEKQEVIEDFLHYVLTKPDTRVVSLKQLETWMKEPKALDDVICKDNQLMFSVSEKGEYDIIITDMLDNEIVNMKSHSSKSITKINKSLNAGAYLISISGSINYTGKLCVSI